MTTLKRKVEDKIDSNQEDIPEYDIHLPKKVKNIKEEYPSQIRILMDMRMIKLKRHLLVLPAIKRLILEGYDIQVLLLDDGEEKGAIMKYIQDNNIQKNIHLLGFQRNIIDYIEACDIVLHPSSTEASSSLIKEAGYLCKTVIACKGVGDFSDYINHFENGFLLNPGDEEKETYELIKMILEKKVNVSEIGSRLHEAVVKKFTVSQTILDKYYSF
jgi:glycosyltransferase involved in cell wall biosynthesis